MKNLIIISIALFALSCGTDDFDNINQNSNPNNNEEPTPNNNNNQENEFFTTWNLVKFEAGVGPTLIYSNNEIRWSFNSNNTVDVEILSGAQIYYSLPLNESGTYSYNILNNIITINENEEWILNISGDTMTIDQNPSMDGRKLTFTKL